MSNDPGLTAQRLAGYPRPPGPLLLTLQRGVEVVQGVVEFEATVSLPPKEAAHRTQPAPEPGSKLHSSLRAQVAAPPTALSESDLQARAPSEQVVRSLSDADDPLAKHCDQRGEPGQGGAHAGDHPRADR